MPKVCVQISGKNLTHLNVIGMESVEKRLKVQERKDFMDREGQVLRKNRWRCK